MTIHVSVRNADTNAPRVSWNMGVFSVLSLFLDWFDKRFNFLLLK